MILSQLVPSANHLWQSTLFAGVAGLLTLFLRKNRAHVRYWIWLMASVKFLLPFSILVALGGLLGRHTTAAVPPFRLVSAAEFSSFVEQVGDPFTATVPLFAMPAVQRPYTIVAVLILVWATGFVILACRWTLRWRRMRVSVRKASPLDLPISLPVKSSPAFGEPGVFGVFRPVLLLPDKIVDHLTAREMESIVAHELCHVRRRDNLATAIHMAVEVVFWFHPLVWWLGARLVEECERACDEEVLRTGGEPRAYAEGILKICELYLTSPLACVVGVKGGDQTRRIEAIMSNRVARRLNYARKAILAVAAIAAVVTPIVVGITNTPAVRAQSSPPAPSAGTPRFEVASIKACKGEPAASGRGPKGGNGGLAASSSPVTFNLPCMPVRFFINLAYVISNSQPNAVGPTPVLEEGPAWIDSDRYQISANAGDAVSKEMMNGPMLRALLEERFRLKFHRETREVPIYALTVAKSSLKLQPSSGGSCTPRDLSQPSLPPGEKPWCGQPRGSKTSRLIKSDLPGGTMAQFAQALGLSGRMVIDKTGITEKFDFHVEYAPGGADISDELTAPSIDSVLGKLGLRLERAKGQREFLVIDQVEKPSAN